MKILSYEIANKWVYLIGAILVAIFLFIFLSIPSCQKPVTPQQTIAEVKVELEKQYQEQLKAKEIQITDYKSRLTSSENKYKVLVSKYVDLERRKNEVKPPTTNAELRDRFIALGFVPLSDK